MSLYSIRNFIFSSSSTKTISGNIFQQICLGISLIVIPNILNQDDYAQVVFLMVLLSFCSISDLGMSLVFARVAPKFIRSNSMHDLNIWISTVFIFGLISSAFVSFVLCLFYFYYYSDVESILLFCLIPILLYVISFYMSVASISGCFSKYSYAVAFRSILSLIAIPLAYYWGAEGWLLANLISAVILGIFYFPRIEFSINFFKVDILRQSIFEGALLAVINAGWLQILNFARLSASFFYDAASLAQYGIASLATISLSAVTISAFLPVSVGFYARLADGSYFAIEYIFVLLRRTVLWSTVIPPLLMPALPFFFENIFHSYNIEPVLYSLMFLSICFYPYIIIYGVVLVGLKQLKRYAASILLSLIVGISFFAFADYAFGSLAAALSQIIVVVVLSWSLLIAVRSIIQSDSLVFVKKSATYLLVTSATSSIIAFLLIWFSYE